MTFYTDKREVLKSRQRLDEDPNLPFFLSTGHQSQRPAHLKQAVYHSAKSWARWVLSLPPLVFLTRCYSVSRLPGIHSIRLSSSLSLLGPRIKSYTMPVVFVCLYVYVDPNFHLCGVSGRRKDATLAVSHEIRILLFLIGTKHISFLKTLHVVNH